MYSCEALPEEPLQVSSAQRAVVACFKGARNDRVMDKRKDERPTVFSELM